MVLKCGLIGMALNLLCYPAGSKPLPEAAVPVPAETAPAESTPERSEKSTEKKSEQRVEQNAGKTRPLRDPFWPVGWYPENWGQDEEELEKQQRAAAMMEEGAAWSEAVKQLNISGVSRKGREFVAIINTKVRKPGDYVTLDYEGLIYRWRVSRITGDGNIRFERISAGTERPDPGQNL